MNKALNRAHKKKVEEYTYAKWGCRGINPAWCKTCVFAHGEPPFADLPEKAYCEIYSKETTGKPPEVYYDGDECDFYMKDPKG